MPLQRNRHGVIGAARRALERIDDAQLRDRPLHGIDARRIRTGHRRSGLPGGEGCDVIKGAQEDRPVIVVHRILQHGWRRQVGVERAQQVHPVNIQIGDVGDDLGAKLALHAEVGLLGVRRLEVGRESGNLRRHHSRYRWRRRADQGARWAIHQRGWILGENRRV